MAYLSTYSYFLFASIPLSHNQIGRKLLTPIMFIGISGVLSPASIEASSNLFYQISPTGWLVYLISYNFFPDTEFISKVTYLKIFFAQFFIPIILAFLIQLVVDIFHSSKLLNLVKNTQK